MTMVPVVGLLAVLCVSTTAQTFADTAGHGTGRGMGRVTGRGRRGAQSPGAAWAFWAASEQPASS